MAAELLQRAELEGLETIRLSFPDQHGVLRGKTIMIGQLANALRDGWTATTSLLVKDPTHRNAFPVFEKGGGFGMEEMTGAGDLIMVPDPATFRILPWAPGTGWLLCDIYFPGGAEIPFATRPILRKAIDSFTDQGYQMIAGIEVELHIYRIDDEKLAPIDGGQPGTPPDVSLLAHGYQYLTETRADELDPILEILRRDLVALGLPLRSVEVEFGPSQIEFTFDAQPGLDAADTMVAFRSATRQICRRHGYIATFMCRPSLPHAFSSGWHLHQSLCDAASGKNVFIPESNAYPLSLIGRNYAAGLIRHAAPASVFTTPTINGYKRYRPNSLAPERAGWSHDNRGAMIRALGSPDDPASRIENRAGEPAANPYLYLASQIVAGQDGMAQALDPGDPEAEPYGATDHRLPRSLKEALDALRGCDLYREKFGSQFIDYILTLKDFEVARFEADVTDWEHRQYFDTL